MSRGPSEEVRVYQIRVGLKASDSIEGEAKSESKAIAHVLRRIVEDYATLYGLSRSAFETLESDRKAIGLDRRDYFKELLDGRYRQVLLGGAAALARAAEGHASVGGGRHKK